MTTIAALTALALVSIGILHALWPLTPWPFATRLEMARTTMAWEADEPPGRWFAPACLAVALLLVAGAAVLLVRAGTWSSPLPSWVAVWGAWVLALVLLGRGVWGVVNPSEGSPTCPPAYRRLNRRVYGPLCLILGALSATVAMS